MTRNNLWQRVTEFKSRYNLATLKQDPVQNRINQLNDVPKEDKRRPVSSRLTSTPFIGQRTSSRLDDNLGFDDNDLLLENIEWHTSDLLDVCNDGQHNESRTESRTSVKRTSDDDIRFEDEIQVVVTNGSNANKKRKSSEHYETNDLSDAEVIDLLDETSFQSDQQMKDFYLMLSLKQCLSDTVNTVNRLTIGDRHLWTAVHLKMKGEYNFDVNDEIECQIRFEELFAKYLNVLNLAKSVSSASRQFKCFDLFYDIDWQSVADHRHRLIGDLKDRLRSGATQTTDDTNVLNDCLSDWSDWSE